MPVCFLREFPNEDGENTRSEDEGLAPNALVALCGGTGFNLGQVDHYHEAKNTQLGLFLVETERFGNKRVMVFWRTPEGTVAAENITGDLAVTAGRLPGRGVNTVTLDYSAFEADGRIAVAGERVAESPDGPSAVPFEEVFDVSGLMQRWLDALPVDQNGEAE